mmetsp:Transcript_17297/g.35928  ORF Transcript_17297/g.35928 Transcript_17297/m.35928 type:complete len:203 (+) Transcript_17297:1613-2221(+)
MLDHLSCFVPSSNVHPHQCGHFAERLNKPCPILLHILHFQEALTRSIPLLILSTKTFHHLITHSQHMYLHILGARSLLLLHHGTDHCKLPNITQPSFHGIGHHNLHPWNLHVLTHSRTPQQRLNFRNFNIPPRLYIRLGALQRISCSDEARSVNGTDGTGGRLFVPMVISDQSNISSTLRPTIREPIRNLHSDEAHTLLTRD